MLVYLQEFKELQERNMDLEVAAAKLLREKQDVMKALAKYLTPSQIQNHLNSIDFYNIKPEECVESSYRDTNYIVLNVTHEHTLQPVFGPDATGAQSGKDEEVLVRTDSMVVAHEVYVLSENSDVTAYTDSYVTETSEACRNITESINTRHEESSLNGQENTFADEEDKETVIYIENGTF